MKHVAALASLMLLPHGAIYVANERGASIAQITPADGRVQTFDAPVRPHNVQISADGKLLFAVGGDAAHGDMPGMSMPAMPGKLLVYAAGHMNSGPVAVIPVGEHPAHVVADRASRYAYVSLSGENAVAVVDLRMRRIAAKISTGSFPHGMRLSADGGTLYVADMRGNSLSVIDTAARRERMRIAVGKSPVQVAPSPDGKFVYVSLSGEDTVAQIDVALGKVVRKVRVGANPAQIFLTARGELLAANQGTPARPGTTLSVIALPQMRVVHEVAVGKGAHGVASDRAGRFAFVTGAFGDTLTVVDLDDYRAYRTYAVGAGPNGVTFRP